MKPLIGMKGINLCKISAGLWLLFQALPVTAQRKEAERSKSQPNVIIILTDDMGVGDLSAFGGTIVPTPNIDKLAANGLKLTHYYSGAPICSPSRASILTGMQPGKWNFVTYLDKKSHNKDAEQIDFLNPKAPSMARFFKNAGYVTGHFGKWHMGGGRDVTDAPKFDQYGINEHASTYESPEPDPLLTATNWIWSDKDSIKRWNRTAYFVDKTLDFMNRHRAQPCFVNLWPDEVHTPWVPKPDAGEETLKPQSEAAFKRVLQEYDIQIGRLIDGLKASGLLENTIIIFTSDNGALPTFGSRSGGFRGSKLSLYEGGIRMPFIVSWPGHIPAGTTDDRSELHATDLLPTLSKLSGVTLPAAYQSDGVDRSAVLLGKPSFRKKEMFWEYGRNTIAYAYPKGTDKSPQLAVRSGEWKLLMNHDRSNVELYNIIKDPAEASNVAATKASKVNELSEKLLAWWKSLPKLGE
ncbi:sulfatase-like hydrolase/transferase [Dyadobacter chenwenxiniae]|uniref:Sulfatase-like hydrolase/transferase n=1 Tax=Dyadobacter chenwenxiniae TaxID=2906456 RepID=A0A9X1TEK7_9BACT|nr:sulfatase-like hydrolase/transferase [Dyadobacter chenwenxiniae]MCF0063296.1 sulfatase-like hydrolase/transferase [Dyadobacter chenwenxiniae]UON85324.1 sulfatase-like hydrolase/transferase [Dyadobacter chenwenxiniae]